MRKSKKSIEATLTLTIGGKARDFSLSVPEGKVAPNSILTFARELTNKAVEIAVEETLKEGRAISCSKGCGACCVQLVPISDTETREIAAQLKRLPKDKKLALMDKFEKAKEQLKEAGLWEVLCNPSEIEKEQIRPVGHKYFEQQINCPFLEEGSCSIHPVRPLSCREFLVTSPAIYCSNPNEKDVVSVNIPKRISNAFAKIGQTDPHYKTSWVPLILAPFWQKMNPNRIGKKTGQEWVEEFLAQIK